MVKLVGAVKNSAVGGAVKNGTVGGAVGARIVAKECESGTGK